MDPVRVALSLIGIVIIIIAAYYATWFISVKASGQGHGKLRNKNINLVDRFAFSKDKSFCLVEIAGKVYVIGITNQSMTLIDTLEASAFAAETVEQRQQAVAWDMIPGSRFTSRMTKRLATFIAHKMGKQLIVNEGEGGATFAESMKNAHAKKASAQPADRTIDPKDA